MHLNACITTTVCNYHACKANVYVLYSVYNFVFLIFVDQFWNCGICDADAHEKTQTRPLVAHELSKVSVDVSCYLPT